jgi:catechol 2,3-dioxygenase
MGMTETARRATRSYLRGWDDYEHHTLKLTASNVGGMGHFAFRRRVPSAAEPGAIIEKAGSARDGRMAISGTARVRVHTPDGHNMELTGRPSGTGAAAAEAVAQEPGDALPGRGAKCGVSIISTC